MAPDHQPTGDLYRVLGVAPTASAAQIATAYRRLVRDLHPDTRADPAPLETTRLGEVLAAYEVLGRPERRASYDEQRRRMLRTPTGGMPIPVRHNRPAKPWPATEALLRAGPVRVHGSPGHASPLPSAARPAVLDDLLAAMERWLSRPWG
jgi:curved DNA-binding protein CbpA